MARYIINVPDYRSLRAVAGSRLLPVLLAFPFLLPAARRLLQTGLSQPAGLLSDTCTGLVVFGLAWYLPRLPRITLLLFWAAFQVGASELHGTVRRLPTWQDGQYLFDATFLQGSLNGLHLFSPGFAIASLVTTAVAISIPLCRCGVKPFIACLLAALFLVPLHGALIRTASDQDIAGRYQALHWLLVNSVTVLQGSVQAGPGRGMLPLDLTTVDLQGEPLLAPTGNGRHKNVLLVVLEGISGSYLPEIRRQMGGAEASRQMRALVEVTADAMLVPDFVVHNHQTIRGLYAMHCGDLSKLSFATPKAFELETMPDRAEQCLPAQLAEHGWETHYLQGAPLPFMNKDRVMPVMGFKEVHGVEWFTERTTTDFIWGTSDEDFFRGAIVYVRSLQERQAPWFLSLLTVATHQPYAVTEEAVPALRLASGSGGRPPRRKRRPVHRHPSR